jgi:hypothetical protein
VLDGVRAVVFRYVVFGATTTWLRFRFACPAGQTPSEGGVAVPRAPPQAAWNLRPSLPCASAIAAAATSLRTGSSIQLNAAEKAARVAGSPHREIASTTVAGASDRHVDRASASRLMADDRSALE